MTKLCTSASAKGGRVGTIEGASPSRGLDRTTVHPGSVLCLAILVAAIGGGCGDGRTMGAPDAGGGADGSAPASDGARPRRDGGARTDGGRRPIDPPPVIRGWPEANDYSWDGSWSPSASDFPLDGLLDDVYNDGHRVDGSASPILPPGEWDYEGHALANWRNFSSTLGTFDQLEDAGSHHYGWRFMGNGAATDYQGPAAYFEGSSGPDLMDLGAGGAMHSFGEGNLADGPDVLIFNSAYSLDFRTGSTESGRLRDNDLVVAGCDENTDGSFDIITTTIHTGPGSDWVFARDMSRAAIDLGNGNHGRTGAIDDRDGNDLVVLRGNIHDTRVYGGWGHDTAVWYLDDGIQTERWLGLNFFGGGGEGDALWGDEGTDRLVMVVPTDAPIVDRTPTPAGSVYFRGADGGLILDDPTQGDRFAAYCVECGVGPGGRKTVVIEYRSADESVFTGEFYLTAFEELQIGIGDGARVYRIDDVNGRLEEAADLTPFEPPSYPTDRCAG